MEIGFDSEKYLNIQSKKIQEISIIEKDILKVKEFLDKVL